MVYKLSFSKVILALCSIFILDSSSFAQEWSNSVVTDPAISSRCENLAEKRQRKILHKQKLVALEKRNLRLQKVTPENKLTVRRELSTNLNQIRNELTLVLMKIEQLEEDIIRKGCPGIRF